MALSDINQLIFNKGKMKIAPVIFCIPLLKLNDGFPWETFWQDFSGKDRFWLAHTNNFYQNEMPTKIQSAYDQWR